MGHTTVVARLTVRPPYTSMYYESMTNALVITSMYIWGASEHLVETLDKEPPKLCLQASTSIYIDNRVAFLYLSFCRPPAAVGWAANARAAARVSASCHERASEAVHEAAEGEQLH